MGAALPSEWRFSPERGDSTGVASNQLGGVHRREAALRGVQHPSTLWLCIGAFGATDTLPSLNGSAYL